MFFVGGGVGARSGALPLLSGCETPSVAPAKYRSNSKYVSANYAPSVLAPPIWSTDGTCVDEGKLVPLYIPL